MMKTKHDSHRYLVKWLLPFFLFIVLPLQAQIGTWHNYLAYYEVQQIQAVGNELFIRASNGLYQYNKTDQSITTYDKTNGLSDTYINKIRWCQGAKRLVVVYDNSNIDLVETNGTVTNISDIYTKSVTGGKNIYNIYCYGNTAYLSCDYGISKVNVKDADISESYMLGFPVSAVTIEGNAIYAQSTTKGVWTADLSKNLIDPANWTQTTTYPSFDEDLTDYNNNIELVKTLQPGGPRYNKCGFMRMDDNRLLTCRGLMDGMIEIAYVQGMENKEWKQYLDKSIASQTGQSFINIYEIDSNPIDKNHIVACAQNGLYDIRNGSVKFYNSDNSPIEAFSGYDYQIVSSAKFDKSGNLWLLNSLAPTHSLLEMKLDGTFVTHDFPILMRFKSSSGKYYSLANMKNLYLDSRGLLWFVNNNWTLPSLYMYNISTDKVIGYEKFVNQDNTTITVNNGVRCCVEDTDGNMWVGTSDGLLLLEQSQFYETNPIFTQVKVPRNDGSDLADYLLAGVDIQCIAIDGGGRKWIGTNNSGVYLISKDNMTQLQHFTSDNSQLLSNTVTSIAINKTSGEVFFGTEKGLCSYISDATEPATEMTKDNVWAYPNPVTPEYTGLITVVGLTNDADVKILAPNGALIAQGRSNGGTFTWNGNDQYGNRVASGVYMVATATSDGNKGTVCKIAIVR